MIRDDVTQISEMLTEIFKSIHQRSYHRTENENLYPSRPKLLSLIKAHEGISQKDLSEKTYVTPATITGILNKLEANHYVYRIADESDKRVMRVYLTPEGHLLAKQGEAFLVNMIEQLFDGFTDEELHTFLTLTEKLRNNIKNTENKVKN